MSGERVVVRVPPGLGAPGKALWKAILADVPEDFELDARELHALRRACRTADEIALLEAAIDEAGAVVRGSRGQPVVNRALEEVRMMRLVEARLLASIKLSVEVETPSQARSRKAVATRWRRENQRLRAVE